MREPQLPHGAMFDKWKLSRLLDPEWSHAAIAVPSCARSLVSAKPLFNTIVRGRAEVSAPALAMRDELTANYLT